MCEECLEYTCEHKFDELNLDLCCICLDDKTKINTCFMGCCKHSYHTACIQAVSLYNGDISVFKCPICRKQTQTLVPYLEYRLNLANRFVPQIGSVPAFIYAFLYDNNLYRIEPTNEMKKYFEDVKSLYGITYINELNHSRRIQSSMMRRVYS